jgi:RNA polymerase sigma-70 factor (ECF subfamily)
LELPLVNTSLILRALKKGDKQAFANIYNQYHKRIYAFAFSITKSEYASEEILQNVFITLWKHKSKVDPSKSFDAFIFTITRNAAYNFLREVANRDSLKKELWQRIKSLNKQAYNDLIFNEYGDIVDNIVEALPKQQKAVYILSKEEGKTNKEIAELLGITEKTVKNHLWKATKLIRKQLTPHISAFLLFF